MSYATASLSTIPGLIQIGTTPDKVGALAFVIPGLKPEDIGKHLDREGIAVRAGHHCAQPALKHFGLTAYLPSRFADYLFPDQAFSQVHNRLGYHAECHNVLIALLNNNVEQALSDCFSIYV